jgi:hypothetical protein
MNEENEQYQVKKFKKEKEMTKLCKKRGWNINELTTGQMLFILNHPDIKKFK